MNEAIRILSYQACVHILKLKRTMQNPNQSYQRVHIRLFLKLSSPHLSDAQHTSYHQFTLASFLIHVNDQKSAYAKAEVSC